MNYEQLIVWIRNQIEDLTDPGTPEVIFGPRELRVHAVTLLQLGRDAGIISDAEYAQGMNVIIPLVAPGDGSVWLPPTEES